MIQTTHSCVSPRKRLWFQGRQVGLLYRQPGGVEIELGAWTHQ